MLPSDESRDMVEEGVAITLNHLVDMRFHGLKLLFLVEN